MRLGNKSTKGHIQPKMENSIALCAKTVANPLKPRVVDEKCYKC